MRLQSKHCRPVSNDIDHKACMRDHRKHHNLVRVGLLKMNGDCPICGNSWQERIKMKPPKIRVKYEKLDDRRVMKRRRKCDGSATNAC